MAKQATEAEVMEYLWPTERKVQGERAMNNPKSISVGIAAALLLFSALLFGERAEAGSPTCPNLEGPGYYFDSCGTLVSPHHPKPQCDKPPLPCQEEGYAERQKQLEVEYQRRLHTEYRSLLGSRLDSSANGAEYSGQRCAENGSCYGDMNQYGVPKTVHVDGYYRSDGTYVRGHYRGKPRK